MPLVGAGQAFGPHCRFHALPGGVLNWVVIGPLEVWHGLIRKETEIVTAGLRMLEGLNFLLPPPPPGKLSQRCKQWVPGHGMHARTHRGMRTLVPSFNETKVFPWCDSGKLASVRSFPWAPRQAAFFLHSYLGVQGFAGASLVSVPPGFLFLQTGLPPPPSGECPGLLPPPPIHTTVHLPMFENPPSPNQNYMYLSV